MAGRRSARATTSFCVRIRGGPREWPADAVLFKKKGVSPRSHSLRRGKAKAREAGAEDGTLGRLHAEMQIVSRRQRIPRWTKFYVTAKQNLHRAEAVRRGVGTRPAWGFLPQREAVCAPPFAGPEPEETLVRTWRRGESDSSIQYSRRMGWGEPIGRMIVNGPLGGFPWRRRDFQRTGRGRPRTCLRSLEADHRARETRFAPMRRRPLPATEVFGLRRGDKAHLPAARGASRSGGSGCACPPTVENRGTRANLHLRGWPAGAGQTRREG